MKLLLKLTQSFVRSFVRSFARLFARRLVWWKQQLYSAIDLAAGLAAGSAAIEGKAFCRRILAFCLVVFLSVGIGGCNSSFSKGVRVVNLPEPPDLLRGKEVRRLSGAVNEVAPPATFLDLNRLIAEARPQVEITAPKANQVIEADRVEVQLTLEGLSIYRDETLALGPHIQVILDNQPARSVFDLDEPLVFTDLTPGSHTLRAIAVRPWGESFKEEGAYAQISFHVLAETSENVPDSDQPLLTYLEPQGSYGAEPVLLDFYLNNAPLHAIAQESAQAETPESDHIADWRIQGLVNGQSFVLDQWRPLYLKGLTPGQNWVQLTLVDTEGNPLKNTFNSTVRTFTYDPSQPDPLAKIIRGDLPVEQIGQIVSPGYLPPIEPPTAGQPVVETPTVEPFEPINPRSEQEAQIEEPANSKVFEPEALEPETVKPEKPETVSPATESLESELPEAESLRTESSVTETPSFDQGEPELGEDLPNTPRSNKATESTFKRFDQFLESPRRASKQPVAPVNDDSSATEPLIKQENDSLDNERSPSKDIPVGQPESIETGPFEIKVPDSEVPNSEVPDSEVLGSEVPDGEVPDVTGIELKGSDVEQLLPEQPKADIKAFEEEVFTEPALERTESEEAELERAKKVEGVTTSDE